MKYHQCLTAWIIRLQKRPLHFNDLHNSTDGSIRGMGVIKKNAMQS